MSVAVVGDLLRKEAFTDDVVKSFVDNKISLPIFMDLNNEDFKELGILALGDRKKLKNLIAKLQNHEQRGLCTTDLPVQRQEANSVPTNEDVIPLMQRAPSDLLQTCDSELDGFYDDDLLPNPVSMPGETSDTSGNNEQMQFSSSSSSSNHMSRETSFSSSPGPATQHSKKMSASVGSDDDVKLVQNKTAMFPVKSTIIQNVPDKLCGWEDQFKIPTQYSESTMHCLSIQQLNGSSRREIVHAVVYKMLNHCKFPSSKQIDVVASKIIQEFGEFSRDALGTGYGSWSKAINNRLKNSRRLPKHLSEIQLPHASKKRKLCSTNHQSTPSHANQLVDDTAFKRLKTSLLTEWKRQRRNVNNVRSLMQELKPNRRHFILTERPTVYDVLEVYPPLRDFDFLIFEFSGVIGSDGFVEKDIEGKWVAWEDKIVDYSKSIKSVAVTDSLTEIESDIRYKHDKILKLLTQVLDRRKKDSYSYIGTSIIMDADDIDEIVRNCHISTPYYVRCNEQQYFVVLEQAIYLETKNFFQAMMCMMACYFVYDMAYPKECMNTLTFLEKFIFNISSGLQLSKTSQAVITDIKNRVV